MKFRPAHACKPQGLRLGTMRVATPDGRHASHSSGSVLQGLNSESSSHAGCAGAGRHLLDGEANRFTKRMGW
jgi:hypothetical protein